MRFVPVFYQLPRGCRCVAYLLEMPLELCVADRPVSLETVSPCVFKPALAEHTEAFSRVEAVSVGVDRMQRNFEPMRKQGGIWRQTELK